MILTRSDGIDEVHHLQKHVGYSRKPLARLRFPSQVPEVRLVEKVADHSSSRLWILRAQLRHEVQPLQAPNVSHFRISGIPDLDITGRDEMISSCPQAAS